MNKSLAIVGCGWLGMPLAKRLLDHGYSVNASTTSKDKLPILTEEGISAFQIDLKEHSIDGDLKAFLKDIDILIIAFPPKLQKNPDANFVSKMAYFVNELEQTAVKNIIYVSSTSVFEDQQKGAVGFRVVTEDTQPDGTSKKARQLIEGENLLKNASKFNTTILRFGGLIGRGRHPAKYLSGKKELKNAEAPVNLIHLEDCLDIIMLILKKGAFGTVFHAVNPIHQSKKEYYQFKAEALDLEKPLFDSEAVSKGKVIYSKRLNTVLGFEFQKEI